MRSTILLRAERRDQWLILLVRRRVTHDIISAARRETRAGISLPAVRSFQGRRRTDAIAPLTDNRIEIFVLQRK